MQSLFRRRRSNYKIKTADHWNNKLYFKIKLWFFVLKLFPSSRGGFRTHQSGRYPFFWQFPQNLVSRRIHALIYLYGNHWEALRGSIAGSPQMEIYQLGCFTYFSITNFQTAQPRVNSMIKISWRIHPVKVKWQTTSLRRYVPEEWPNEWTWKWVRNFRTQVTVLEISWCEVHEPLHWPQEPTFEVIW